MKCPICGQQLRPGKKDPNYLLCYNCKKKFKVPQQNKEAEPEQKYSNIPPKKVREKRETEMRKAYDDLLSIEDEKKEEKKPLRSRRSVRIMMITMTMMMYMMMSQCQKLRSLSLQLQSL